MIKAVFFDFDGTFYSHTDEKVPESTKLAIQKLKDNGIYSFLCTGRAKLELTWFNLEGIKFDGYILNNGQVCFDANWNLISANFIEGKLKDIVINIYNEKKIPVMLCTVDDIFANFVNKHFINTQKDIGTGIPDIREYNNENIVMASVFFTDNKDKDKMMSLKDIAEITYWHEGAIDIVPPGASKSKGIDTILEKYNIKLDETMAIGDGQNDIEMLKHTYFSIAMGNAIDEVKEISDYVTDDIDNDGLYKGLKHFNLI